MASKSKNQRETSRLVYKTRGPSSEVKSESIDTTTAKEVPSKKPSWFTRIASKVRGAVSGLFATPRNPNKLEKVEPQRGGERPNPIEGKATSNTAKSRKSGTNYVPDGFQNYRKRWLEKKKNTVAKGKNVRNQDTALKSEGAKGKEDVIVVEGGDLTHSDIQSAILEGKQARQQENEVLSALNSSGEPIPAMPAEAYGEPIAPPPIVPPVKSASTLEAERQQEKNKPTGDINVEMPDSKNKAPAKKGKRNRSQRAGRRSHQTSKAE